MTAEELDRPRLERMLGDVRPRLELWVAARLGPRLRARLEVDDIVQEILLKAVQGLDTFVPRGERAFYAWLFKVAEHRIADLADRVAAQKRDPARERELSSRIAADETSPSVAAARNETQEQVLCAMAGLPERHREILRLRRLEMLGNKEAGARLGITAGNASVLYARALEALRRKMGTGSRWTRGSGG